MIAGDSNEMASCRNHRENDQKRSGEDEEMEYEDGVPAHSEEEEHDEEEGAVVSEEGEEDDDQDEEELQQASPKKKKMTR